MANDRVRLGKQLKVGETFRTTTKTMTKDRGKYNCNCYRIPTTYEVLRCGDRRFFTKGKRRYWCEVVALIETRTGFDCWPLGEQSVEKISLFRSTRWWQFTYLVRILEN
jgi:hypothetical protein